MRQPRTVLNASELSQSYRSFHSTCTYSMVSMPLVIWTATISDGLTCEPRLMRMVGMVSQAFKSGSASESGGHRRRIGPQLMKLFGTWKGKSISLNAGVRWSESFEYAFFRGNGFLCSCAISDVPVSEDFANPRASPTRRSK